MSDDKLLELIKNGEGLPTIESDNLPSNEGLTTEQRDKNAGFRLDWFGLNDNDK